jgi:hypothetical protein
MIEGSIMVRANSQPSAKRVCSRCESTDTYRDKKGYYQWHQVAGDGWMCNKCYYREIDAKKRKEYIKQYRSDSRQSTRTQIFQILADSGVRIRCVQCGYDTDIRALQFDHINGRGRHEQKKVFPNHEMMCRYYAEHPDEAKTKLQILCANCNCIKVYTNNERLLYLQELEEGEE